MAEADSSSPTPQQDWRRGHHVFVLSHAGKPIFCTNSGSDAELSSLTAVMQALISFVRSSNGDELQCVEAGDTRFVFVVRDPLYLVCVCEARDPASHAARVLHYVHLQILFVLSASIEKVFSRDAAYDLRSLLGGTDKALCSLIRSARTQPDIMLDAVPCIPLPPASRAELGRLLQLVESDLLFAVLCARGALVSVVSPRRRPLVAPDLILLLNLLGSSLSLRTAEESWVPFCLPHYERRGFVHGHISFLDPQSDLCLILVTHRAEDFTRLASARARIAQRLSGHAIEQLRLAVRADAAHVDVSTLGIRNLWHFLYVDRAAGAYVCARYGDWTVPGPGGGAAESGTSELELGQDQATGQLPGASTGQSGLEVLMGVYSRVRAELYAMVPPLWLLFLVDGRRAVLAHASSEYELYTAHSPLTTKSEAAAAAHAVLRWVRRERTTLLLVEQLAWPS